MDDFENEERDYSERDYSERDDSEPEPIECRLCGELFFLPEFSGDTYICDDCLEAEIEGELDE